MGKLLSLALLTGLLVIGCTIGNPSSNQTSANSQSAQMAELHQEDSPVAAPGTVDVAPGTVTTSDVTYTTLNDTPITGYLAQPVEETDTPRPGIIVIQEWWGLNDNIRTMTRRLAAEGYTALAVDLYNGQVADTPDEARTLVKAAIQNSAELTQNVVAAYDYLTTVQQAPKVGSIGWCFGGTWSLNTALALPTDLDAAVIYYGGQIATEAATLEPLQLPIQGHFGSLDTSPSPETVQVFADTLDNLGKDTEIYLYDGANHAFANPSGTRYNAEAASLAWQRTIAFLKQHLKVSD